MTVVHPVVVTRAAKCTLVCTLECSAAGQGRAARRDGLLVTFQQAQFPNSLLQVLLRIRNWERVRPDKLGQRMTEGIVTVHQKVVLKLYLEAQSIGVLLW